MPSKYRIVPFEIDYMFVLFMKLRRNASFDKKSCSCKSAQSSICLRGAKFNSLTKNAWSRLVSAYNMHISTSLPKKVSGVHRFEPTTAGTGEPVLGAKIRYFTFLPISPPNEQI